MTQKEVLDGLKAIIVERLRFDPRRAAEMTPETTLPKGIEGSLGLDSLDFMGLSVTLERFGLVIDKGQDLSEEFQSLDAPHASSWPRAGRRDGAGTPGPGPSMTGV